MKGLFYSVIRRFGTGCVAFFAWFVSTGYFLFLPKRLANSLRFYKALFPDKGFWTYLRLSWAQYHGFARNFSERLALAREGAFNIETPGWETVQQAFHQRLGGVFVMSHLGNWEVAARVFHKRRYPIMLFMGARPDEQVEQFQKTDMRAEEVTVHAVESEKASPIDLVAGLRFVKGGGFVAMTGDRLWNKSQRTVEGSFLGRRVKLPAAPFEFAALAQVPLFVFFPLRTGRRSYTIVIHPPLRIDADGRQQRAAAVQEAAQTYLALLEETVRQYPQQWYHFEQFI